MIVYCCLFYACKRNNSNEGAIIPPLPDDVIFEQHKAAIQVLSEEIYKNSSNPEYYYKRAMIYYQLNNINEAKADLDEALTINQNDGRFRLLKAEILRSEGNYKKALEEAKVAEILGLKSPEIYTILGDLSQKTNQMAEAVKYLNFAKEIAPNNGEVYYYIGLFNAKNGDTTAAIDNYYLAKKLKPRFIDSYKRLSEIYNNQGNSDLAMRLTIDLAKLYPNDAENCSILAKIFQRRMNIDSALIFYKKAISIKPKMYQVSYDGGLMCLKNNYFEEAISFFENTYKYAPKTPFINTSLGLCYENMGNKAKALEYYTIGFSINNRDFKAIEGIKRLEDKPYYTEESYANESINEQLKASQKKTKADTTKIRLIEIQPKNLSNTKRDSVNNRLQNSNKFPIPIIK